MNVLVVAPHMDDEILGCGGAIVRHVAEGDILSVCFIANRIYNHRFDRNRNNLEKKHAIRVKEFLGYKEAVFFNLHDERLDLAVQDIIIPLEEYVNKVKPDIVYIPFFEDNNQDHRSTFNAARIVLRPLATGFIKKIYMYEVPSSTEQSPPIYKSAFLPNYYINISEYFHIKIQAYNLYATEKREYPHPRSKEAISILCQMRGIEMGFKYAEAFMILRDKWE